MLAQLFVTVCLLSLLLAPAPLAQAVQTDCPVPQNSTWQNAIQLASGQSVTLTMPGNSEGWYKFFARAGTVVTISATGNPGDPNMALYDKEGLPGKISAASLKPQSGTRISFTVPETAWYWAQVTNHDRSATCMSMNISLEMRTRMYYPIISR